GKAPGVLAVLDDKAAVDEDVFDARRVLVGLLVGGAVADPTRIEHDEVGPRADRDDAPILEPETARRKTRHLVNRLGQRQHALLARVFPEDARKGAVAPRMWLAPGRAAGRERRTVGADHDGLVYERPPEIALVELKEDHRAFSALGLEQLQRGVDRVHTAAGRDLLCRLLLEKKKKATPADDRRRGTLQRECHGSCPRVLGHIRPGARAAPSCPATQRASQTSK